MRTRTLRTLASTATCFAISLLTTAAAAASWSFVQEGTPLLYLKGTQTPAASWISPSLQEGSEWLVSAAGFGIGYGDGDDTTVLSDMMGNYMTVYVRSHFTVGPELSSIKSVTIQFKYDDGFVAYLNGIEIGRASVPSGALQASTAATSHEATDSTATFQIDPSLLMSGDNVLAIEVHNASMGSSDLSMLPTLIATDGEQVSDAAITRGPFLQQVARRSALVVWETDKPSASSVSYGASAAMGLSVTDSAQVLHHVVKLEGLAPGAMHYYQVQSASVASPQGQFMTEPNLAAPMRLAAFGDTRSNHTDHASVIAGVVKDQPLLAMHVGDLVSSGAVESDWDTFFKVEKALLRNAPLYPVPGNHEGTGPQFANIFELPEGSPSPERTYTFRYGPVRVWAIDQYGAPYGATSAQFTWLTNTLAEADSDTSIRHRIVLIHHGPYSSGSHGSNLTVRNTLAPLFKQHGVSLVLSGHDHHYERSTIDGIKYVITGGGGAPKYTASGDWWTEVVETVLEYCLLDVHGPKLEVTCKRTDGSILDNFVLGNTVNECSSAQECAAGQHHDCEPDEQGSWECVESGCVWNCVLPAPQPDAGTEAAAPDAAGDSAEPLPAEASTDGGAGSAGSAGAAGAGLDAAPEAAAAHLEQASGDSGCGCAQAGRAGLSLAAGPWLALVAWAAARRRKRPTRLRAG